MSSKSKRDRHPKQVKSTQSKEQNGQTEKPAVRTRVPGPSTNGHPKQVEDAYWIRESRGVQRVRILGDSTTPGAVLVQTLSGDDRVHDLLQKDVFDRYGIALDRSCCFYRQGMVEATKRSTIEVNTNRHVVRDQTIEALQNDMHIFTRGESLGVVIQEESEMLHLPGGIELESAKGMTRFSPLAPPTLSCYMTKNAEFFRVSKDKDGEEQKTIIHPPNWLIGSVHEARHWPGIRHLQTITNCPYIRDDGSLPWSGYDRSTGALYCPSVQIARLPDRPDQNCAREAAKQLRKLVDQFPFETTNDFTVWLAYLLNLIQRPVISGPTPGFAFNGNKAGCGKGLLINEGAIIAHGHSVGTRAYPADNAEAEKVKLALGLAGVSVVHFDNLTEGGSYGGSVVDSMLTSTIVSSRILGQSRDSGPVPLRPTWTISGNNISPAKDSSRRWLICNLVTLLDSPHERDDIIKNDLRSYTAVHRAEFLALALTILKAHAMAERPTDGWAPLGSFEEWDRIIRGAVWFATGDDCLVTQREGAKNSPEQMNHEELLKGLKELDPNGTGRTAQEIFTAATAHSDFYVPLQSALLNMAPDGKVPNPSKIGIMLRSLKNKPIKGMRLETVRETRNGVQLWRVGDICMHS